MDEAEGCMMEGSAVSLTHVRPDQGKESQHYSKWLMVVS